MFATHVHDDTKVDLTSGSGLSASPSFVSNTSALQTLPPYGTVAMAGSGASLVLTPLPTVISTGGGSGHEVAHLNAAYAAALGPLDDNSNSESVICTAVPVGQYYGGFSYGDVLGSTYSNIPNYTPAISNSSDITLGLEANSPFSQSNLCQFYYQNISGDSSPTAANWGSFVDQATAQVNSVLSANPINPGTNVAAGTSELIHVGAQCVNFVTGAAGIAAAMAVPAASTAAAAATARVVMGGLGMVQAVANYYGCYNGLSNLDSNEQAALHSWGESLSNTLVAMGQDGKYLNGPMVIHAGTAARIADPSTSSAVHAITTPTPQHGALVS